MFGALRSDDDGKTFHDLGIVISAAGDPDCSTPNRYFAGGNGDFSAIADQKGEYIYFFYSNYSGDKESQGIATARILIEDLDFPTGNVFKYFEGEWQEPGLGDRRPLFLRFLAIGIPTVRMRFGALEFTTITISAST